MKSVHPFRERAGRGKPSVYYACACPHAVSRACANGNAARNEYILVVTTVRRMQESK